MPLLWYFYFMSKEARLVPLPEVNECSERIILGDMGLPVGFDQERLLVQLPRLERIAQLAGMGTLTIAGFRGDTTEYSYGVGGMSGDGVGAAVSSMVTSKAKMHESSASQDNSEVPPYLHWHDGSVKINNVEIEERIKGDDEKWSKGVFDERARAKYMSSALQRGLMVATHESVFPDEPLANTLVKSGLKKVTWAGLIGFSWHLGFEQALLLDTAIVIVDKPATSAFRTGVLHKPTPPTKHSLASRIFYDRYMAAQGLNLISRLIRAR
jgi:hypothetical protein